MKAKITIDGNEACLHCWLGAAMQAFMNHCNGGQPIDGIMLTLSVGSLVADAIYDLDTASRDVILDALTAHARQRNETRAAFEGVGADFDGVRH